MEKVSYAGWPNCIRLANEQIELIITTDVGPRIIRLAFLGGVNEFHEFPDMVGKTGGEEWRIYGGHRLWHSPEVKPRSYGPDNTPIKASFEGDVLHLIQPVEALTGIQKEMEIRLSPDSAHVQVTHRLRNTGAWAVELAAWALSVMAPGGMGIVPQTQRHTVEDLLPNRSITLWPYTKMNDPRWQWGDRYVCLHQDPECTDPTKFGISAEDGWCAYAHDGRLFLKKFQYQADKSYPDNGCSVEMYTNENFLELETVGPLQTLAPEGGTVEHVEDWYLFRDVAVSDEESITRNVLPLL